VKIVEFDNSIALAQGESVDDFVAVQSLEETLATDLTTVAHVRRIRSPQAVHCKRQRKDFSGERTCSCGLRVDRC
jgi:hypothetical protein